jgi:hypothetical protein
LGSMANVGARMLPNPAPSGRAVRRGLPIQTVAANRYGRIAGKASCRRLCEGCKSRTSRLSAILMMDQTEGRRGLESSSHLGILIRCIVVWRHEWDGARESNVAQFA